MKYVVSTPRNLSTFEAARFEVLDGALIFSDESGALLLAIAPGLWSGVRLADLTVEVTSAKS